MSKRIALVITATIAVALLWTTAAAAAADLDIAAQGQFERDQYPSSGFEIALLVVAGVVLVAAGFLLRYLSRPRGTKSKAGKDDSPQDTTPRDQS